jgi:hypothetical protein
MKIPAIFAIVLFTFLVGCSSTPKTPPPEDASDLIHPASTVYGNKVIHLNIPNRLSMLQIQQAILNAALDERWITVDVGNEGESGLVQLRKSNVFAEANFTFLFQPVVVDGYSNSFTTDITGKPTRRYTPPLWIDGLRESIKKHLEKSLAGY